MALRGREAPRPGAGRGGAGSQGESAWPQSGGGVMAEAALDAVRRELREFPAAARGEWVRAETATVLRPPPGCLRTWAGPWACGEAESGVGCALTLLGRRHHISP